MNNNGMKIKVLSQPQSPNIIKLYLCRKGEEDIDISEVACGFTITGRPQRPITVNIEFFPGVVDILTNPRLGE